MGNLRRIKRQLLKSQMDTKMRRRFLKGLPLSKIKLYTGEPYKKKEGEVKCS
jgi:hypothetical protein